MSSAHSSEVITFLFADLESSTRLWETVPQAMASALERHDAILKDAIESRDGRVLKSTGDGLMAIFDSASNCVEACVEGQRRLLEEPWGETGPLRVRMGVHTGEAHERAGDYFGPPVNRAARIMAAAHGGQVLLSAVTVGLARDRLPSDVSLRDLGEQRLKDLLEPERIFQLVHPDLPLEFPPLETLDRRPNNLPTQISEFLGRETELREIGRLLREPAVRLLTLIGPGGIGKTRLALQTAAEQIDVFDDGLFFVDLSAARDADTAFDVMRRSAGVTGAHDEPLEALKHGLASRRVLLVLDNFEQVVEAADGVADLLFACPYVKVLVTSREALRLRGERLFHVPTLGVPPEGEPVDPSALSNFESVRLFAERARDVQPTFALTDENAASIAEICTRLDGLPLALELAAARLRLFSPDELRNRLRDRLQVLRGGARDLPERQRTLRSTIEWSYDLLDDDERSLFRVLSVFSPTRVAAVEEVAVRLEALRDTDVIDRLESLTDKSLVRSLNGAGPVRLSMLETIKEYASERLQEERELSDAARQAHALYFTEYALARGHELHGERREAALTELEADAGNLRTAWRYWVDSADVKKLGDLVDPLWALYDSHGWYQAIVELTRDLLGVLSNVPASDEIAAEQAALNMSLARGVLAIRGYTDEVEQAYNRALGLLAEAGEVPQRYQVLRSLASFHLYRADFAKAAEVGRELLQMAEKEGDTALQVEGHLLLGCNLAFQGDIEVGLSHLDRSIALFDPKRHGTRRFRLGSSPGVVPYTTSALLLWMQGYPEQAVARATGALRLSEQLQHPFTSAYALFHVGLLDLWRREMELAKERAEQVMDVAREHSYQVWGAVALVLHGLTLTVLGDPEKGLIETEGGVAQYRELRTPPIFWPVLLSLRGAALALARRPAEGLDQIEQAMALTAPDDMLIAELELLKGDIFLGLADVPAALSAYGDGYKVAEKWGSRMQMLQIATRLVRVSGSDVDATRLRAVLGWFTEGFETIDLVEARAALDESERPVS